MLRAALNVSPGFLVIGLAGLALIFLTVTMAEWRHIPNRIALTALLDQYNQLGGLLMAADILDTSSWLAKQKTPVCPQIEWRARSKGALTPEQMAALQSDLKSCRMKMAAKLKRLQASGMTISQLGDASSSTAGPNDSGLKAFLKANAKNLTMADISALCQRPGQGGVDRGRGDAIMTWKTPSSDKGARYRDVTTPLAGVAGIEESQPLGVTLTPPSSGKTLPLVKSGVLNEAAAGGESALIHQVRPRHKGAVRRYFNRAEKKSKPVRPDFFDEIWSGWS